MNTTAVNVLVPSVGGTVPLIEAVLSAPWSWKERYTRLGFARVRPA